MNCSSLQLSNTVQGWHTARASRDEAGGLQHIRRLLAQQAIDLGELGNAISAVPRFAFRLLQMMNASESECTNVSDAAVLAGRAGIETLLDECSRETTPLTPKRLEWGTRQIPNLVKL